ncbi:MAG TPA: SCO family protein [Thermoanaerobaculia bacterium]|nr:SCO family protein [Thermoanaerobaculia bacterium]
MQPTPLPARHSEQSSITPRGGWVRPLAWGLLLAALVGVAATAVYQRVQRTARQASLERQAALPVLGRVPDFTLTNRDGRTVRRQDLAGAPWIADFVFTRCVSSCPLLSARLARLDRALPPGAAIRLVSFTVDPAYDTPAVLEKYARSFAASRRWLFLTGDEWQLRNLSWQGFKLALEPGQGKGGVEAILHSTRFALVDADGIIRGSYPALDPDALQQLTADARALAAGR